MKIRSRLVRVCDGVVKEQMRDAHNVHVGDEIEFSCRDGMSDQDGDIVKLVVSIEKDDQESVMGIPVCFIQEK